MPPEPQPLNHEDVLTYLVPVLKALGYAGHEGVTYVLDDRPLDGKAIIILPDTLYPIAIDQDTNGETEDLYWWPLVGEYDPGDRDTPPGYNFETMLGTTDEPMSVVELVRTVAIYLAEKKIEEALSEVSPHPLAG